MYNPYHATMVKRWHTNPHLSHTCDPVGYHSGRMGVLALMLWPDANRDLLAACLTHDLGEIASGDIPWGGDKTTADEVAEGWSMDNGLFHHLTIDDATVKRLKFLDRLDAYLWARHHAPHTMTQSDWCEQLEWLIGQSKQLGVYEKCANLLQ